MVALCLALAALVALACASPAAAQDTPSKPTDAELRAQARAYGDAALAFRKELKPIAKRSLRASFRSFYECFERSGLEDRIEEAPEVIGLILAGSLYRELAVAFAPPVGRFVGRLEALETDDAIIAAGVAAWARLSASLDRISRVKRVSCADISAWVRSGFSKGEQPPVPAIGERDLIAIFDADPALVRGERRLLQLGVKSRAARGFGPPDFAGAASGAGSGEERR
jgi:hypothetical protein